MGEQSQWASVARRAADLIEERGLAKGSFINPDGELCLWGALGLAHYNLSHEGQPWWGITQDYIADALEDGALVGAFQWRIAQRVDPYARPNMGGCWSDDYPGTTWNDAEERTEADVCKLLLQMADEIEATP